MTTLAKKRKSISDRLAAFGACSSAVLWARRYRSEAAAWKACQRGDWMLWLAWELRRLRGSQALKKLVRCACDGARLLLPQWEQQYPNDKRVRRCLETAEKWSRGKASLHDMKRARNNALDAANHAYGQGGDDAILAAEAVLAAALAAIDHKRFIAFIAFAKCADVVRKHYPSPPTIA